MAQTQPTMQDAFPAGRLVWIINMHTQPYRASFQSMQITIPPMCEKIPKHVRDGGNLFEYLEARRFVGDFKQPQSFGEKGEPIFGPKALDTVELTKKEREEIEGKTEADMQKAVSQDEKKAKKTIDSNLKKISNKVSLADQTEP